MTLVQVKEPDYVVRQVQETDEHGNPKVDQYGNPIMKNDYSEFPYITRKCPSCGAIYKTRIPELLDTEYAGYISINGEIGLGFLCPHCKMPIVVCANTGYMFENPPIDDSTGAQTQGGAV
jgi:phage FluMu protein Com